MIIDFTLLHYFDVTNVSMACNMKDNAFNTCTYTFIGSAFCTKYNS